jgi:hypothetical protein
MKKKLIEAYQAAPIRIGGLSASGTSVNVTTVLGTALGAAGDGGVSVPVQPLSGANKIGILTSGANHCSIFTSVSNERILSAAGDIVFGRMTEATGVFTLGFFTVPDSGVETAYTLPSTSIAFFFNYMYDIARFPSTAFVQIANSEAQVPLIVGGTVAPTLFREALPITATNVITALTNTPINASAITIFYENLAYSAIAGGGFTLTGKTLTGAITVGTPATPVDLLVGERLEALYWF